MSAKTGTDTRYIPALLLLIAASLPWPMPAPASAQDTASSGRIATAQELLEVERAIRDTEQAALDDDGAYTTATRRFNEAEAAWSAHRDAFETKRNADPDYAAQLARIDDLRTENDAKQDAASRARQAYQSAQQKQRGLRSDADKIDNRIADLRADIERYRKRSAALANAGDDRRFRNERDFENSRAYYTRKINEANGEIKQLETKLKFIKQDADGLKTDEAKSAHESADAEARAAQARLIEANKTLKTMDAKWESRFDEDPMTSMLEIRLDNARGLADEARDKALSGISDSRYRQLLSKRDELKAALGEH